MKKRIIRGEILHSDQTAVMDDKGNVKTFRELAEEAEELVRYMEERSLLFLLCDHQTETLQFLYEVLYMNYVPLLLPEDMDGGLLDDLVRVYRPQYIYCPKVYEAVRYGPDIKEWEAHRLIKTGMARYGIHGDVALLLSTSGTTGSPRLVKISYENLYDNAEYACRHLEIQSGHKGISPLPFYYTYGFSFCLWHWHCGASVLVTEASVLSREFSDFFRKQKANHFAATPYTYQMLQKIRFWDQRKLEYLHWAMSGGAQLSEHDQASLTAVLKEKFLIGYGQTECTCIISAAGFMQETVKPRTIGRPFDNMKVMIDQNTGELLVRSRSVCMGYAECPEHLAESDRNQGLLHTGDVAYMDTDGYIYLKGRLTRYAKILGKRVSLDDVERHLKGRFPNMEFACLEAGQSLGVFYAGAGKNQEKDMLLLLDEKMKIPGRMVRCRYLEKIPRNNAGKIMYSRLKELNDDTQDTENLSGTVQQGNTAG